MKPLMAERFPPFGAFRRVGADTSRRHVELAPPLFTDTIYQ